MGHCNNILEIGMSSKEGGFHDAQKPVKLLETLITLVTIPGQVVLDPFAGSGSTAIAAHNLGRKYIMIEKDKDIYSTMMKRINQHEDSKGLFD